MIKRRELLAGSAALVCAGLVPRSVFAQTPASGPTREQFVALLGDRFYVFVDPRWRRLRLLEVKDFESGSDLEQFSLIFGPRRRYRSRYASRSRFYIPEGLNDFYNRRLGWFPLFVQERDEGRYEAVFSLLRDEPEAR